MALQSGINDQPTTKVIQLGAIDRLAVGSMSFLQGRGMRWREENVDINGEIPMNGHGRQLAPRSAEFEISTMRCYN